MPPCEGGYKEFKIGDLFDITTSKSVDKNGLIPTENTNDAVQFIGRTQVNNGLQGYTRRLFFNPNPAQTFSIIQVGDSVMQYRESEWYASQNIFLLKPRSSRLVDTKLYIIGATNKALMIFNGGYNIYPTLDKLKDLLITLPTTSTGEIDFQFMESRIRELEEERMRELEEERMRELEAYLTAAGFADCSLTPTEEEALRKFSNGEVRFTSYRIGDHFKKLALGMHKKFNKSTDVSKESNAEFNIPLVNAKHGNNGIMYYGKECDYDTAEMTIDVVNDGAVSTGDVYAQPQKTGVLYNAYLIKCISHELDTNSIFYFSTAIGKSIKMKYGYDKKASWERVQNDSMILPTTPEGKIDYDFMETYISAIKKQIIQQLKDFISKERVAYQQVIND